MLIPNRIYLALVASVATAGLAFVGGSLTRQVYREWVQGLPISGGWSWPVVIGIDALCLLACAAIYWKIYADCKTRIDVEGVSRPGIFGAKNIRWSQVTRVESDGASLNIVAGKTKICLTPFAYTQPEKILSYVSDRTKAYAMR